jgi:hypothetical protein
VTFVETVVIDKKQRPRTSLFSKNLGVKTRKSRFPLNGWSQPNEIFGANRQLVCASNVKNSVEIAFIGSEI